jgi:hypothetical protein
MKIEKQRRVLGVDPANIRQHDKFFEASRHEKKKMKLRIC